MDNGLSGWMSADTKACIIGSDDYITLECKLIRRQEMLAQVFVVRWGSVCGESTGTVSSGSHCKTVHFRPMRIGPKNLC